MLICVMAQIRLPLGGGYWADAPLVCTTNARVIAAMMAARTLPLVMACLLTLSTNAGPTDLLQGSSAFLALRLEGAQHPNRAVKAGHQLLQRLVEGVSLHRGCYVTVAGRRGRRRGVAIAVAIAGRHRRRLRHHDGLWRGSMAVGGSRCWMPVAVATVRGGGRR